MLQKIHSHGEGQKKDDAQGKGARHKKQILPAGPCMMKAQGGVDSEQLYTSGSLDLSLIHIWRRLLFWEALQKADDRRRAAPGGIRGYPAGEPADVCGGLAGASHSGGNCGSAGILYIIPLF